MCGGIFLSFLSISTLPSLWIDVDLRGEVIQFSQMLYKTLKETFTYRYATKTTQNQDHSTLRAVSLSPKWFIFLLFYSNIKTFPLFRPHSAAPRVVLKAEILLYFKYSEIPLLRPPKIKTSYLLKTLFAMLKLFFSSFSTPSVSLIRDHLWDCPKVVFKTTFGQSQRWSYYRDFTVYKE